MDIIEELRCLDMHGIARALGWNNDPDNPEFLARRVSAAKLMNTVLAQEQV